MRVQLAQQAQEILGKVICDQGHGAGSDDVARPVGLGRSTGISRATGSNGALGSDGGDFAGAYPDRRRPPEGVGGKRTSPACTTP